MYRSKKWFVGSSIAPQLWIKDLYNLDSCLLRTPTKNIRSAEIYYFTYLTCKTKDSLFNFIVIVSLVYSN